VSYIIFGVFVDLAFLLDMIIMCITTYRDAKGNEVRNSNWIILRYIKSFQFYPDLFALLGSSFVAGFIPILQMLSLFKVIRVLRLGTFINHSAYPRHIKAPLNLMKFLLYMIIYINFVGCAWWLAIS